ncbi:MAG: MBL fold metallo-hydrolase [Epsilonproteobacteria bacterium]|nr:MBL fold metallo-hydrolase [Campylobacterota bacterium]|tara:strand:+ start:878 stop:1894 length:1017 start_codon:yes stop_codon:yes gene_type:complete
MERKSPNRYCGKFTCVDNTEHKWLFPVFRTLLHSLKVCFFNTSLKKEVQKQFVQKPSFPQRSQEPKITWLGHATFLIQIGGKNIITDPILGSLSFVFQRLVPSVVTVKDLPPIDYIVISHNHLDHMDSKTLQDIKQQSPSVRVLVPMGDKAWFDYHNFVYASEHLWWDEIIDPFVKDLKFTFLPANHWSQRTLFDKNKSLWGSWMIQLGDYKIYFAGDTSWGNHFEQIGQEFQNIDIACMPIAPGEPRKWMKDSHIDAREAVKAFIKLKARIFIPMHWGTFHLGLDNFYTPINLLKQSWQEFMSELSSKELRLLKFGELVTDVRYKFISTIKSVQKAV